MTEKEMKRKLIDVFNALMRAEVKGDAVLIVADCVRILDMLIQTPLETEEGESVEQGREE